MLLLYSSSRVLYVVVAVNFPQRIGTRWISVRTEIHFGKTTTSTKKHTKIQSATHGRFIFNSSIAFTISGVPTFR